MSVRCSRRRPVRACVRAARSVVVVEHSVELAFHSIPRVVTALRDVDSRHNDRLYAWTRRETEEDRSIGRCRIEPRREGIVKPRLGAG